MVSSPHQASTEGIAWRDDDGASHKKRDVKVMPKPATESAVAAAEARHGVDEVRGRADLSQRDEDVVIDLTEQRAKWYDKYDWNAVKIDDYGKPLVSSNDVAESFAVVSAVQQPIIVDEELSARKAKVVVDEELSVKKPRVVVDEELSVRKLNVVVDEELSARESNTVVDEELSTKNKQRSSRKPGVVEENSRSQKASEAEGVSSPSNPVVVDEELSARKTPIIVDEELSSRKLGAGVRAEKDVINLEHEEERADTIMADASKTKVEAKTEIKPKETSRKSKFNKIEHNVEVETTTDEDAVDGMPDRNVNERPADDGGLLSGFFCDMFACFDATAFTPLAEDSSVALTEKDTRREPKSALDVDGGRQDDARYPSGRVDRSSADRQDTAKPLSVDAPQSKATPNSRRTADAAEDSLVAEPKIVTPETERAKPKDAKPSRSADGKASVATESPRGEPPRPEELNHSPATSLGTPMVENEDIYRNQTDDTEDYMSEEEILECSHLKAVPSAKEEVEDSVAPMKPADLGKSSPRGSAAFVEKKAKELCDDVSLNSKISAASKTPSENVEKVESGSSQKPSPSLEARRRTLTKELNNSIAAFGRYDLRTANISAALGDVMAELDFYEKATQLHRDAVSIYSCKLGDDHSTTLDAKMRLGHCLERAQEIEEAINMYYQVTVMRRAIRGDRDPSVADGLVCMANALRRKEDYVQAIKELKRALKIFRESLGDSDKKVSATVDEIASLYITIGDFKKAAAILEEVVKLKAATQGTKSKNVASTLLLLSTAYDCADDHGNALRSMKKAYKIYSEVEGHSSEDATTTLNRMAMLYGATNDFNRAAVAYLGVLRSRKTQHGPEHILVGETYLQLGKALRRTRQFEKALKCLKEALPIFVGQGVEIEDVKTVAEIMHEMALTNQDRGKLSDAIRIFKQELSVRRKVGQPEFPFAAKTLKHLGFAEYQMESYNRALKHLIEALSLYQQRGHEGEECAEVLLYSGLVFQKLRNPTRARKSMTEAVRMLEDCEVDDDNPLLIQAKQKLRSL